MTRTETRELYLVQRREKLFRELWCCECFIKTDFLGLDHAVDLFGISTLELLNGVRMHKIHHTENEQHRLFVCQRSLIDYIGSVDRI